MPKDAGAKKQRKRMAKQKRLKVYVRRADPVDVSRRAYIVVEPLAHPDGGSSASMDDLAARSARLSRELEEAVQDHMDSVYRDLGRSSIEAIRESLAYSVRRHLG